MTRRIDMIEDTLPLRRIDHIRFFVGNARQSAYFYRNAFGFDVIAYAGLETGSCLEDRHGVYEFASIRAYGDTTHSFINRDRYRGVFAPGYETLDPERYSPRTFHPVGLKAIDHIVGNVELGAMNQWVGFYEDVMG